MSKLPVVSGRETVRALAKVGFEPARQSGSHIVLKKEGHANSVTVPDHKTLKKGTLRAIIRAAGLTVDEFISLL